MDLVNEKYCVFRITVETAALIPKPVWKKAVIVIVAKNKQDALNVYNPEITGLYGAMRRIINCEEIGTIDYIVTDETKAEWKEEIMLMDNVKPATAEETKEMADRLKELGKK